jgi:hypothetical protein
MSGSENPSRAGRLTALATLAVSATLFMGALFGIASIDPNADAAPGISPTLHEVSLPETRDGGAASDRRDCPFKKRDRDSRNGEGGGPSGIES